MTRPSQPQAQAQAQAQARTERVLVVGGGAAGLVTLRNLISASAQFDAVLVERREEVGGVWYWSDATYELERMLGPQRTQGVWPLFDGAGRPHWPSPAYLNLKGNVLPEFLQFSEAPFPAPAYGDVFPTLRETGDYLRAFAQPMRHRIRTSTEVLAVHERPDARWHVDLKLWNPSPPTAPHVVSEVFDRVVVACAFYDAPLYPSVPGIQHARDAGIIHHAKHYRDSSPYRGKKVMVVGNNNSSNEAAAHLAVHNSPQHPVYRSSKRAPIEKCPSLPDPRIRDVGLITEYRVRPASASASASDAQAEAEAEAAKVDLVLQDGSVLPGFDYVILGVGYGHCYPFLRVLSDAARAQTPPGSETVQLTPPELMATRVPNLFRHVLYTKNTSLAFTGVVVSYFPFNLSDLSSRWLAHVWAGDIQLPADLSVTETQRTAQLLAERPHADPADPLSLAGFHLLAGDVNSPPQSEYSLAREFRHDLVTAVPRFAKVYLPWDQERQDKQTAMYKAKLQWLLQNEERIKTDPFDLNGRNCAYSHLASEMMAPSSP